MNLILVLFLMIEMVINCYCYQNTPVSTKIHRTKSFFFLPPIIPLNSLAKRRRQSHKIIPCIGESGLQGICSLKSNCSSAGGTSSGICADDSVCCISYKKCGSVATTDLTYFVNPNFPDVYTSGGHCSLKVIKSSSQICQLRIEFKEFSLSQPSNEGYCSDDFFTITDCLSNKFCGENKNQHIYVNFREDFDFLTLSVDTSSASKTNRLWNMELKQIPCGSQLTAPTGCLMYYTGTSGTVASFNYGEPKADHVKNNRQIRGLNYGICIQWKNEFCSIEWSKDVDRYSFTLSGNSSLLNVMNVSAESLALSGSSCTNNFIIIPNPFRGDKLLDGDKFCGNFFSTTTTFMKPFVLFVVMGQNKSLIMEDEGNRGFKLNYRLLLCRN